MRDRSGFTLLEVMVALAILALAITTMLQLSSQALRLLRVSGEHQGAIQLADRVAREKEPEQEGVESGEEGMFRWERRVTVVPVPRELLGPGVAAAAAPQLLSVAVAVRWGAGRGVELATMRAVLPPGDGATPAPTTSAQPTPATPTTQAAPGARPGASGR